MCIYIYTNIQSYIYIYTNVHIYIYTYIYIYTNVYVYTLHEKYTCVYIQNHIHAYIDVYREREGERERGREREEYIGLFWGLGITAEVYHCRAFPSSKGHTLDDTKGMASSCFNNNLITDNTVISTYIISRKCTVYHIHPYTPYTLMAFKAIFSQTWKRTWGSVSMIHLKDGAPQ